MPFGQVVIGPPGSGKSTYCYGLYQFLNALERPVIIVNLDPAAPAPPYPSSISITSLISLQDAMTAHHLGPNGAMLYCLEYLEANIDWLEEELDRVLAEKGYDGDRREQAFVVFDTPGQVELSTDHGSLKRIVERLGKKGGWRLAAVHLLDAHHILDAGKYVALLLLSLRTMLQMELPHINVLSKIDLLSTAGELPFNLDFYTEVKDLQYLLPLLEKDQRIRRFSELNRVICELIDEFGLVSFETLCVEDKESMLRLVQVVDQAVGYVAPTPLTDSDMAESPAQAHAHHHSHQSELPSMVDPLSQLYYSSTVQEKWIDHRDEYETHEKKMWEQEGDRAIEVANEQSRRAASAADS
ncbi:BZ3500_MvSof-1268-A1-R1_Chr9g10655 [Microbotryum saponariae]|uniref:GPN-loop GTPase 2 n=1 Tax=Microbotryum saponariae TaxID=289078 RepID=A0A2X0MDN5_9BASI|nr:BZ3501_MvSof-1269-A2-R1_Chr9g10403 [Microbotryum saponariae]SDA00465.1 BZ3500_MvSof-1268-A1-R1_Chr9g10655 [Microbotryum saponariae]